MFVLVAVLALLLVHTSTAETLPFPPSYQSLVNDTSDSALRFYEQGNREGLMNIINRDPLIARKVLVRLLQQPDKLGAARTLAELFPLSCDLELDKPLFEFFAGASLDSRKRLLDWVDLITDAEFALDRIDEKDRFTSHIQEEALENLHRAAAEFQSIGFADGEAHSLVQWTMDRVLYRDLTDLESRLEALGKAQTLYEKSGNLRGQAYCLVQLALINSAALQDNGKASLLYLQACEKGKLEGTAIFGHFLSRNQSLAEKIKVDWLKESEMQLEKSSLTSTRYQMLLGRDAPVEKVREMLDREVDPVFIIRIRWNLFRALSYDDRHTEALVDAESAIQLARAQYQDMAAYGGWFFPSVPFMLIERSKSKSQLGMHREAETDCLEALRLLEQEVPNSDANYPELVRVFALRRLSEIYKSMGEYPLAVEKALVALTIARQREAGNDIYYSCKILSELHGEVGELRQAEEYLEEASRLPIVGFVNPAPIALAELHLNFQLYEEALRDLERLEKTFEDIHKIRPRFPRGNWWATQRLRLLTEVWLRLAQPEKALETARVLEARNHPVEQGMLGMALIGLGRYSEAEKYFQARLDSVKGTAWPQKEVDALVNLGKICQAQKRYREAGSYLQKALELYRQMGSRRGELEVLLEMAQLASRQNDLQTSDERSRQALALATEFQDPQGIWSAQYRLARIALSQGQKPRAIQHLEAAVDAVETVSGNIKVDLYKTGFLEDKIQVFDELIRLLGTSNPAEAFHYAERRQARAFLEAVQRRGVALKSDADELYIKKEEAEGRLIGKQRALVAQLSKPQSQRDYGLIDSLRRELRDIRVQHTQLLKTLELRHPAEAALQAEVTPLGAQQVQNEILGHNQALIEYVVTDQEALAFVLDRNSCKFVRLPISRKALNTQVRQLHLPFQQLREGRTDLLHLSYDVSLALELYKTLFLPLEPLLQGKTDIIIVPDEVLNYLPFESLARSGVTGDKIPTLHYAEYREVDWLVRHYTIRYAFSATSLDPKLREAGSSQGELVAFGISGSTGSQNTRIAQAVLRRATEDGADLPALAPLPLAAKESRRVAQIMAGKLGTRVFTDGQATESAFFREAPAAGYLHLAVHSLLNNEQPYYSALLLAPEPESDGLLQTFEIASTHLNAQLVTLSGCETALGKMVRGEGLLGLRRAFLQAGARSVLVSLWSVEDSTADFMEEFYKNLGKDLSSGKALRSAKIQYMGRTLPSGQGQRMSLSHPFFWAPFVLTTTSLDSR